MDTKVFRPFLKKTDYRNKLEESTSFIIEWPYSTVNTHQ